MSMPLLICAHTLHCTMMLQVLGLVGSPGKGKHTSFERVRRGLLDVCEALDAEVVIPVTNLCELEACLHKPQVQHH